MNKTRNISILLAVILSGFFYSCGQVQDEKPVVSAPSGLAAVAGDKEISLSWNIVPEAVSYKVYWGLESGNYTESKILMPPVTNYKMESLVNDTKYFIIVTALDMQKESGRSKEVDATPSLSQIDLKIEIKSCIKGSVTIQTSDGKQIWTTGAFPSFESDWQPGQDSRCADHSNYITINDYPTVLPMDNAHWKLQQAGYCSPTAIFCLMYWTGTFDLSELTGIPLNVSVDRSDNIKDLVETNSRTDLKITGQNELKISGPSAPVVYNFNFLYQYFATE
jgi:hypothetical protein